MVERVIAAAETSERTLSRETFDVGAVATRVGPDHVKLFEWVRDNTTLVPYRGVLRGAAGVLMDRQGNSLDRALLLADLLRAAGTSARLAHGTLSREQALPLTRSGASPSISRPRPPVEESAAIATYAAARRLDEARLRAALEQVTIASRSLVQGVEQRIARQTTEVVGTFKAPQALPAQVAAADLEAMRDHWWVQVQRDGQWVDLDPTAVDAAPGRSIISTADVMAPADVPQALYHDIVIRVIVERWRGGHLEESTALEHTLRPLDLLGQRVLLRHAPLNRPSNLNFEGDRAAAQLTEALLAQNEWLPALTFGSGTPITQSSFTETGHVNTTPGSQRPAAPQAGFGGLVDAFGGGDEPTPEPKGYLTAEWIEYEVRSPGRAPERIRRDVFDLVGPAARTVGPPAEPNMPRQVLLQRAMALAGDTEILALVASVSQEFVAHVMNTTVLRQRDTLRQLLQTSAAGTAPTPELLGKLNSSSGELYALALARTSLSPVKDQVFLDRPNVFSFHRRIQPNDGGDVVVIKSLDIVTNDVAVRSTTGTEGFHARVAQGVTDTAVEALALGGGCNSCNPVANVSELRASASQSETPWVSIQRIDDPAWREVTLSPDARRRVEHDIRGGYVVLIPSRPIAAGGRPAVGWWRVDPKSGSTLGIMESGQGQGTTEFVLLVTAGPLSLVVGVLNALGCVGSNPSLGKRIACGLCGGLVFALTFVAIVLTIDSGGAVGVPWLVDIGSGTLCNFVSSDV